MPFKIIGVSMDEQFFQKMEQRRKQLNINRSEYLRGLVLRDIQDRVDKNEANTLEVDG